MRRCLYFDPGGQIEMAVGVTKPPESTDLTRQSTVSHVRIVVYCRGHCVTSAMWPRCPLQPLCFYWSSVCVRERNVVKGLVRVDGCKGNTRAVFVQGTGLSSLAHTHTHSNTHTWLKTEAYCRHPAQLSPPTTVTHCMKLSIFMYISLSLLFITNCPSVSVTIYSSFT